MAKECPWCGQPLVTRVGGGIRGPRVWRLCSDDACDWIEWTEPEAEAPVAAAMLSLWARGPASGETTRGLPGETAGVPLCKEGGGTPPFLSV